MKNTKTCPVCKHQQKSDSKKCRHCGWDYPVVLGSGEAETLELKKKLSKARTQWLDNCQRKKVKQRRLIYIKIEKLKRIFKNKTFDRCTKYKCSLNYRKSLYILIISIVPLVFSFWFFSTPKTQFEFAQGTVDRVLINGHKVDIKNLDEYEFSQDYNDIIVEKLGYLPYERNVKRGKRYLLISLESVFSKAKNYFDMGVYDQAIKYFLMINENPDSYFYLGYLYNNVESNYALSNQYYTKGCKESNSYASCYNLGVAYENGWGVDQDYEMAFHYYLKSEIGGDNYSNCALANAYFEGLGTDKNYSKSKIYFEKTFPNTDFCINVKNKIKDFFDAVYQIDGIKFSMGFISGGDYMMGCLSGDMSCRKNEIPAHQVSLKDFKIMETEVTFALWDTCAADGICDNVNDESFGRDSHPVINVSFDQITDKFIPWLNERLGLAGDRMFRLPSEAQWEYAARAGSSTRYSWGENVSCSNSRYNGEKGSTCSFSLGDSFPGTAPVASFSENSFGLFDMHGNVSEWTLDCSNESYTGAPVDGSAWLNGNCFRHVVRGGSWMFGEDELRSSYRSSTEKDIGYIDLGFRLVQNLY